MAKEQQILVAKRSEEMMDGRRILSQGLATFVSTSRSLPSRRFELETPMIPALRTRMLRIPHSPQSQLQGNRQNETDDECLVFHSFLGDMWSLSKPSVDLYTARRKPSRRFLVAIDIVDVGRVYDGP